jgi:RND superfamily putative drug exporter
MEKLARLVLRHKLVVVLVWLVAAVAGGFATVHVGDRLTGQLAQPGRPAYEANQEIARTYGGGGDEYPVVAVFTAPERVDAATLGPVFENVKARVVSYANTGDPKLLGADGRSTIALLYPSASGRAGKAEAQQRLRDSIGTGLPDGWTVEYTGMELLEQSGGGAGLSVLTETLLGALGALAVLAFVYGSFLALIPLVIALVSILTCFLAVDGLTAFTEVSMIVQFIVALIGLGVAIDYSLLLVTRWREERGRGLDGEAAVVAAMRTAGRSVLVSGLSVTVGLLAMVFLPIPFLRSVGYGGVIIPMVSVLAVLTLLPVILAKVGHRLEWPRRRRPAAPDRGWTAWTRLVVRFRWPAAVLSLAILAGLASAALDLRLGDPRSGALAQSGPAYEARTELIAAGIPTGALTPIEVLAPPGTDIPALAGRLANVPGVYTVLAPDTPAWRTDTSAVLDVLLVREGDRATIDSLRKALDPGVRLAGAPTQSAEFISAVYGAFPMMLALIAIVTFILLVRSFRSILLPLKAILLNLLSLAAICGAIVLLWQRGYGSRQLWDIAPTGSITEFIPVMVFAFLYGLSMDYEVFILARIREEYDRTGSTDEAVVAGIGRTGRLVTSAALVLFLAFASLAAAPNTELKIFATALGLGILLDATLIRGVLVPALISIFGRAAWWAPRWLAGPDPRRRS